MFRRKFIAGLTVAGVSGLSAGLHDAKRSQNRVVTFHIKGFSCVTCATGLDTILRRHKGVVNSTSSYPNATTILEFNPAVVSADSLKALISEMGFNVL